MSCPDCNRGSILSSTPTGTIIKVAGIDTYFAPAPPSELGRSSSSVVVLSDAFGLPLVNTKLIADQLAKNLACDVWAPDLFNGEPWLDVDSMTAYRLPDRPGHWFIWDRLCFYTLIISRIGIIIRNRPSVVDRRVKKFIKAIRDDKKYSKVGGVGYCYGGGVAARLANSADDFDSVVICHPALISLSTVKATVIPSSWVCAEEDNTFPHDMRVQSEMILAERKEKGSTVPYEFVDYKGTVHGFACRPNLDIEEIKEAFEKSMEQTRAWFRKTL